MARHCDLDWLPVSYFRTLCSKSPLDNSRPTMEPPSLAVPHNGLKVLNDLFGFGSKAMDDVILAAIHFDGNENIPNTFQSSINSAFGISVLDTRDLRDHARQISEKDVASLIGTQMFCTGSHSYWSKALRSRESEPWIGSQSTI